LHGCHGCQWRVSLVCKDVPLLPSCFPSAPSEGGRRICQPACAMHVAVRNICFGFSRHTNNATSATLSACRPCSVPLSPCASPGVQWPVPCLVPSAPRQPQCPGLGLVWFFVRQERSTRRQWQGNGGETAAGGCARVCLWNVLAAGTCLRKTGMAFPACARQAAGACCRWRSTPTCTSILPCMQ
jgi:hypothetical protein